MNLLKTLASPPSSKYDHLTHPKYRADIDGLRAIAVLSVVLFHAFPTLHSSIFPSLHIAGGFIGVDIFFVISGFLISTIIFDNLERGSFSFLEFYSRRIKRIFPALLLVLIACFVFGWFALLADEYKQLGKHIAGGAGFVSNFVFWNESGYFDNDAETKPLLHLWTLGIEEQFYIIWPLLLWAAWKRKFNLLTITVVIATISFFLNIKGVRTDPVATFYSPQTRFWELLIGSILAYVTLYKPNIFPAEKLNAFLNTIIYSHSAQANPNTFRNIQSFIGTALIVTGILTITKEGHFPGTLALLPTLGAVLIISSGPQALVNRLILSNRILVWFGLISFPLYLWHWPLLSFARIVESETPTINIRIAVVVISIVLAWLTYKFIEKPIRFGRFSKLKVTLLIILMGVTGYVSYVIYIKNGIESRLEKLEIAPGWGDSRYSIYDMISKYGNRNSEKRILVFGDSHVNHISRQLRDQLGEFSIDFVNHGGCFMSQKISLGTQSSIELEQLCKGRIKTLESMKGTHYYAVITGQKWHGYGIDTEKKILEAIEDRIYSFGIVYSKLIILGSTPTIDFDCEKSKVRPYSKIISCPESKEKIIVKNFSEVTSKMSNLSNVFFVYPYNYLCPNDTCVVSYNGVSNYADLTHLSYKGGYGVVREIRDIINR